MTASPSPETDSVCGKCGRACAPTDGGAQVCHSCRADARLREITARLVRERGELTDLEREVARKVAEGNSVARHLDEEFQKTATAPDRLADSVARVGGSWRFVVAALSVICVWMVVNALRASFDPYPFILLNLVLSCLAALQAPIIMMSQNRAGLRDRAQATQDFEVNLKAELEISALHAKVDHLMQVRWDDLVELQELQLELLRNLERRMDGRAPLPSTLSSADLPSVDSKG